MKKLILAFTLILSTHAMAYEDYRPANSFYCQSKDEKLKISYATTSMSGKETFQFVERGVSKTRFETAIQKSYSPMGQMVSVNPRDHVVYDGPSWHLTLLLPSVNLEQGESLAFTTQAFMTRSGNTIGGPGFIHGVIQHNTKIEMTCRAEHLSF